MKPGFRFAPHVHTADPAAHVFSDGRLWLFADRDPIGPNPGWWCMHDYHAFSTRDLETWTDHGCVLSRRDIAWAAGPAWDGDCIESDGRFWYFFPMVDQIGVAVADHPRGPFRDALGTPLITRSTPGVRPTSSGLLVSPVCVRGPEGAFLYFGQNEELYCAPLAPDLLSLAGPVRELAHPWRYHESPWVFHRAGRYHMIYGRVEATPLDVLAHASAPGPYGPFEYHRDVQPDAARTVHGCVVEWGEDDLLFYHEDGPDPFHRHIRAERVRRGAREAVTPALRGSSPVAPGRCLLDPLGRHLGADFHEAFGRATRERDEDGLGGTHASLAGKDATVFFRGWSAEAPVCRLELAVRVAGEEPAVLEIGLRGRGVDLRLSVLIEAETWRTFEVVLPRPVAGEWDLTLCSKVEARLDLRYFVFHAGSRA